MDFTGKLFLAVIEEDNTQRALFRVRPLLCEEGNITPEDLEELIDEGFLRVVPDKAEQHTFKERMRDLGQLCLINLKDIPPDFNKVRLNKNYAPNRGENNRYVIYSDAIEDMSGTEVFEVVSDPKVVKPTTAAYYLRNGGHIQGPYDSSGGNAINEVSFIAPDNHRLFSVTMPDEREKLFFWPSSHVDNGSENDVVNEEEKETERCQTQEEESSMSAEDKIEEIQASIVPYLKAEQSNQEEKAIQAQNEPAKHLVGTPIKNAVKRDLAPRSDHLNLHSVVDRAVRQSRPEEPSASIQNSSALHPVINPAEQFRQSLEQLWNHSESKQQAVNDFLSMPGASEILGDKVFGNTKYSMQTIMQQQLNQLEAERLSLMMELERIKENRTLLLKDAIKESDHYDEELLNKQKNLESVISTLDLQCEELSLKRTEILKDVNGVLQAGNFIAPAFGVDCSFEKTCKLIAEALNKAGFDMTKNDIINLLIIVLLFPELNLRAEYLMDAKLAISLLSNAVGGVLISDKELKNSVIISGGDVPVFITAQEKTANSLKNRYIGMCTTVLLSDSKRILWPSVFAPISVGFNLQQPMPSGIRIKAHRLKEYLHEVSKETPEEVTKLLLKAEELLKTSFPLCLKQAVNTYLMIAQSLMEGGAAAAVDYAFASFLIPFAIENRLDSEPLRSICEIMPKASSVL